jgi:Methylase involved in ubiquinone/menaquinone biosynthesis
MSKRWKIALAVVAILAAAVYLGRGPLKRFAYAPWDRDSWQMPAEVLRAMKLQPGQLVADIGAGGGYFTFRFARAVGETGRVFAVDIDTEMLEHVRDRARRENIGNVEIIEAQPDDPRLPPEGVDVIFICNTYHHLSYRENYFRRLRGALRPNGRLMIVEFDGRGWFATVVGHHTPPQQIREEMQRAGYRLAESYDFLPRQSFLIFIPSEDNQPGQ